MPNERSKLIYSTDRTIPRKEPSPERPPQGRPHQSQKSVSVRIERKGRAGKSVSVIEGLPLSRKEQEGLLKQLKAKQGTRGTFTDTSIEIQGDHRDALMALLEGMGHRAKRSGG
jgi:translation initiation factor 1